MDARQSHAIFLCMQGRDFTFEFYIILRLRKTTEWSENYVGKMLTSG